MNCNKFVVLYGRYVGPKYPPAVSSRKKEYSGPTCRHYSAINDFHRAQVNDVPSEIQRFAQIHEGRLHYHENVEAIQLLDNTGIVRRLQRKKPFELV